MKAMINYESMAARSYKAPKNIDRSTPSREEELLLDTTRERRLYPRLNRPGEVASNNASCAIG